MKKILFEMLMLLPMVTSAESVEIDGIYYNLIYKGNVAEVTVNPNGYVGDISIPKTITYDGTQYSVTSICDGAFRQDGAIVKGLKSISIPKSITAIGYNAFYLCHTLTKVHIEDIESWCKITFANGDSNPANYAHHLFMDGNEIKELVIPNTITSINNYAFRQCSGINSISIPNSVTSIGDDAFLYCSGLTSLDIPNSVLTIGSQSFMGCDGITTLTIGEGLRKIGSSAFQYCKGLKKVKIPNNVVSIGVHSFIECENLTTLEIGEKVNSIDREAFAYCPAIKEVYCYAEIIPNTHSETFYNSYIEYATLYVIDVLSEEYKNTTPWNNFGKILCLSGGNEPPKCSIPTISYAEGKLTFTCETEGAECIANISDADIKTHYGNEIQLTATYTVSVYATATGYENSDIATATLCWIDTDPKTEGIENGVAQVRANAVLIQSHDGTLNIAGVADGTDIAVYSTSGQMVGSAKAHGTTSTITTTLRSGNVAIIRIGDKSVKVVMQ